MKADHDVGANKLIGLDPEDPKYDPLEKWACVAQELAAKLKASNERVKQLRVDLDQANERIKELHQEIAKTKEAQ